MGQVLRQKHFAISMLITQIQLRALVLGNANAKSKSYLEF